MKSQLYLSTLAAILCSFVLNVENGIASGTENPGAGSVREDQGDSELDEKREDRRAERRSRLRKKRKLLRKESDQKSAPTQEENVNDSNQDGTSDE